MWALSRRGSRAIVGVLGALLVVASSCKDTTPSGQCELALPAGSFSSSGDALGPAFASPTVISGSAGAPGLVSTQILVSPSACLCDVAAHSRDPSPARFRGDLFWIELSEPCADAGSFCTAAPSAPGTWTIGGADKIAIARVDRCAGDAGASIEATAGTVVVTGVDDAGIRGTFDLTLGGARAQGSFDAPRCAAMGYHYAVAVDCR
jgi:hypothetical protein